MHACGPRKELSDCPPARFLTIFLSGDGEGSWLSSASPSGLLDRITVLLLLLFFDFFFFCWKGCQGQADRQVAS